MGKGKNRKKRNKRLRGTREERGGKREEKEGIGVKKKGKSLSKNFKRREKIFLGGHNIYPCIHLVRDVYSGIFTQL